MTYDRKTVLDTAAACRDLARALRTLQHDEDCPPYLKAALAQTRHYLGTGYGGLQLAAERLRDPASYEETPGLQATIDQIQPYYRFTDFRAQDKARLPSDARASLVYVLCHDHGFSTAAVAAALKRDERAISRTLTHARRDLDDAGQSHQSNDVYRYVHHMRAILKGAQAHAV